MEIKIVLRKSKIATIIDMFRRKLVRIENNNEWEKDDNEWNVRK